MKPDRMRPNWLVNAFMFAFQLVAGPVTFFQATVLTILVTIPIMIFAKRTDIKSAAQWAFAGAGAVIAVFNLLSWFYGK